MDVAASAELSAPDTPAHDVEMAQPLSVPIEGAAPPPWFLEHYNRLAEEDIPNGLREKWLSALNLWALLAETQKLCALAGLAPDLPALVHFRVDGLVLSNGCSRSYKPGSLAERCT